MSKRDSEVRIYLADLTHTGVQLATESFPLNIGLIASYARNNYIFDELVRFLKQNGVGPFIWVRNILDRLRVAPLAIRTIHDGFLKETREELWDSEEALVAFNSEPPITRSL